MKIKAVLKHSVPCLLTFVLCLASCFASAAPPADAAPATESKLLFVADALPAARGENAPAAVATWEQLGGGQLPDCEAVALPYGSADTASAAKEAFGAGKIVYLYGDLTIEDYKRCVGLEQFALRTTLNGADGTAVALQYFDPAYEASERFSVISFSDHALLCKISALEEAASDAAYQASPASNPYLTAVANNFEALEQRARARSSIVDQDFDITSYFGPASAHRIILDHTLYQNQTEQSVEYDYFGLKTRVWIDNPAGVISHYQTAYALPYQTDQLVETGPASQRNTGEVTVNIGYGSSGPSGSISYTMDLSDKTPTISRTEDYTNDTVTWEMLPKSTGDLNGLSQICGATWASRGSKLAAIDVSFSGQVEIDSYGVSGTRTVSSGTQQVQIRFEY